jgi:4,5:9,10-diseco-3-hydroxy-5,9,17-trioxoandrosta-1(10),2-diene-4-oate hydrolase
MLERSAVGATQPWHKVQLDGVSLAYNDEGEGPAVVCLHAIGHGAGDFARLRQQLRSRYRVVALDWPGQGNSSEDHIPASAARYTDLLMRFLDALAIERAVLLGNSIGGAAAIRCAAAHPERVRGLILANPGGLDRGGARGFARVITALMARFFAAGARGARWYPRAFAAYYRMVLSAPAAAEQRARIVASAVEVASVLAQAWRSFGEPDADIRALAPQVRCPVLFTWATGDRINQLSRCRAAIKQFPQARLETFAGGHAAFLEAPEQFESALTRFLAALADGGECARPQ